MWCSRFFCRRFFNAHYWPKIGVTVIFKPAWALNSNQFIGQTAQQPVTK